MLHVFAHHNWKWVLDEAVCELEVNGEKSSSKHVKRARDLPSQRSGSHPPLYSLFRIEYELPDERVLSTWSTSTAFAFLDPKDGLFRELKDAGCSNLMPATILLPWDIKEEAEVNQALLSHRSSNDSLNLPALLKAPLGSGGFGLYFVETTQDIVTIIARHAKKAEDEASFIEKLRNEHGGQIPQWSLQKHVRSLRVRDGQKMQIRCYSVIVERPNSSPACFLYSKDIEVRIPTWDEEIDGVGGGSSTEVERFEEYITGNTTARPYNRGRNKSVTDRVMLWEIEGDAPLAREKILNCTRAALLALEHSIKRNISTSCSIVPPYLTSAVGICGIDLMLSQEEDKVSCHIVELNHNPAMPGPNKRMSASYRLHLKTLVGNTIKLGLGGGIEHKSLETLGFENIWR